MVHSRPGSTSTPGPQELACTGKMGFKPVGPPIWRGGFQLYNVLSASGYEPRWDRGGDRQVQGALRARVETMPESAAAALEPFVAAGGTLVTLPCWHPRRLRQALHRTARRGCLRYWANGERAVDRPAHHPLPSGRKERPLPVRWFTRPGWEGPYVWSHGTNRWLPGRRPRCWRRTMTATPP